MQIGLDNICNWYNMNIRKICFYSVKYGFAVLTFIYLSPEKVFISGLLIVQLFAIF